MRMVTEGIAKPILQIKLQPRDNLGRRLAAALHANKRSLGCMLAEFDDSLGTVVRRSFEGWS